VASIALPELQARSSSSSLAPHGIRVAELFADLNEGNGALYQLRGLGHGRRVLSFAAETASLNLPHSYGIALRTTATQGEGVHRKKS